MKEFQITFLPLLTTNEPYKCFRQTGINHSPIYKNLFTPRSFFHHKDCLNHEQNNVLDKKTCKKESLRLTFYILDLN